MPVVNLAARATLSPSSQAASASASASPGCQSRAATSGGAYTRPSWSARSAQLSRAGASSTGALGARASAPSSTSSRPVPQARLGTRAAGSTLASTRSAVSRSLASRATLPSSALARPTFQARGGARVAQGAYSLARLSPAWSARSAAPCRAGGAPYVPLFAGAAPSAGTRAHPNYRAASYARTSLSPSSSAYTAPALGAQSLLASITAGGQSAYASLGGSSAADASALSSPKFKAAAQARLRQQSSGLGSSYLRAYARALAASPSRASGYVSPALGASSFAPSALLGTLTSATSVSGSSSLPSRAAAYLPPSLGAQTLQAASARGGAALGSALGAYSGSPAQAVAYAPPTLGATSLQAVAAYAQHTRLLLLGSYAYGGASVAALPSTAAQLAGAASVPAAAGSDVSLTSSPGASSSSYAQGSAPYGGTFAALSSTALPSYAQAYALAATYVSAAAQASYSTASSSVALAAYPTAAATATASTASQFAPLVSLSGYSQADSTFALVRSSSLSTRLLAYAGGASVVPTSARGSASYTTYPWASATSSLLARGHAGRGYVAVAVTATLNDSPPLAMSLIDVGPTANPVSMTVLASSSDAPVYGVVYSPPPVRPAAPYAPPPAPAPAPAAPPAEAPDTTSGFGAVTYTSQPLSVSLSARAPWRVQFYGATVVDALKPPFSSPVLWNGSSINATKASDVILVKVTATVTPLLAGGSLTCALGITSAPPYGNLSTAIYTSDVGTSQQLTFEFPVFFQAAFIASGGAVMLISSVLAQVTSVRISMYPLSTS